VHCYKNLDANGWQLDPAVVHDFVLSKRWKKMWAQSQET